MGLKADLKQARELVSQDKAACLSRCETLKAQYAGTDEGRDGVASAALGMMMGSCALALGDAEKAEEGFAIACAAQPDAPQAWKGLVDALEASGKVQKLPPPLLRMAEIAEGKGNDVRGRSLRLRAAIASRSSGDGPGVVSALQPCLEGSAAAAAAATAIGAGGTVADAEAAASALQEAVHMHMLAAVAASAERSRSPVVAGASSGAAVPGDGGLRQLSAGWRDLALSLLSQAVDLGAIPPLPLLAEFEHAALRSLVAEVAQVAAGPVEKRSAFRRVIAACETLAATPAPAPETPSLRDALACLMLASWWLPEEAAAAAATATAVAAAAAAGEGVAGGQEQPPPPDAAEELFAEAGLLLAAAPGEEAADSADAADAGVGNDAVSAAAVRAAAGRCLAEAGVLLAWRGYKAGDLQAAATYLAAAEEKEMDANDWRVSCLRCLLEHAGPQKRPKNASDTTAAAEAAEALAAATADYGPSADATLLEGGLALAAASALSRQRNFEAAAAAISNSPALATATHEDGRGGGGACLHCEALCARAALAVAAASSSISSGGDGSGGDGSGGDGSGGSGRGEDEAAASGDGKEAALSLYRQALGFAPDHFEALSESGALLLAAGDAHAALPLLEKAAAAAAAGVPPAAAAEAALRLGRCYWELGGESRSDRSRCFASLLRAAKLDPGAADSFAMLGQWYAEQAGDEERAKGCLARAVSLDPCHALAGPSLAAIHLRRGQEALALSVFRRASKESSLAHWAWAGLGRSEMARGQLTAAAELLQQALRGGPSRWDYWADLAWVYHSQSRQQAALKAYSRAALLLGVETGSPTEIGRPSPAAAAGLAGPPAAAAAAAAAGRVRVLSGMGQAQREIGQVDEAVASFRAALAVLKEEEAEGSSSASAARAVVLHGAAEALLAQAHARTSEGLCGHAADCLREGARVAAAFIGVKWGAEEPELGTAASSAATSCGWKLLADLHTYGHRLPPSCFGGAEEQLRFMRKGRYACERALEMETEREANAGGGSGGRAAALYDLGLNLYAQARLLRLSKGEGSGPWPQELYDALPEVASLTAAAEAAFREAVAADPSRSDAWNGLGATIEDPLKRQHCLVRAAQIDHHPAALANLALLLLAHGLDGEAYEALGALQAAADHPLMWVCLGILKEREAEKAAETAAASLDVTAGGMTGAKAAAAARRDVLMRQAADACYAALETAQHPDGLAGLAATAWNGGGAGMADALAALAEATDLAPANAWLWNLRGCLLLRRDFAAAAAAAAAAGEDPSYSFELQAEGASHSTEAVKCLQMAVALLEQQRAPLSAVNGAQSTFAAAACEAALAAAAANLGDALLFSGVANAAAEAFRTSLSSAAAAGAAAGANTAAAASVAARASAGLGRALAAAGQPQESASALLAADSYGSTESAARSRLVAMLGMKAPAEMLVEAARGLAAVSGGAVAPAQAAAALGPVMAAAAAAKDPALAMAASRELRNRICSAGDATTTQQRLRYWWGVAATQRECGAPRHTARKALLRAIHQCPGAPRAWLAAAASWLDDAAAAAAAGDYVAAAADAANARRCAAAAVVLAERSLRGAERQASAGSGTAAGSATAAEALAVATASDARDYARALGLAAAADALVGRQPPWLENGSIRKASGKGGKKAAAAAAAAAAKSEPEEKPAVTARDDATAALRQLQRALRMYPGDVSTWRLLSLTLLRRAICPAPLLPPAASKAAAEAAAAAEAEAAEEAAAAEASAAAAAAAAAEDDTGEEVAEDWEEAAAEEGQEEEAAAAEKESTGAGPSLASAAGALGADGTPGGAVTEATPARDMRGDLLVCRQVYRMVAAACSGAGADERILAALEAVHVEALLRAGELAAGSDSRSGGSGTLPAVAEMPHRPGLLALASAREAAASSNGSAAAIVAYKEAVTAEPMLAAAWQELSAVYEESGQPRAAEAALRCGVQAMEAAAPAAEVGSGGSIGGGVAGLYLRLAALLARHGRSPEAREALDAAAAAAGAGVAGPEYVRAAAWLAAGKAKKAADALQKAAAADPRAPALPRLSAAAAAASAAAP